MSADTLATWRYCGAWATSSTRICAEDAVTVVTLGCVHEHIKTSGLCEEHSQYAAKYPQDLACWDCRLSAVDPHDCPVLVRPWVPAAPVRPEPARPLDPYELAKFEPIAEQVTREFREARGATELRWPLTDPFEEMTHG
jgi:hypothetical protein